MKRFVTLAFLFLALPIIAEAKCFDSDVKQVNKFNMEVMTKIDFSKCSVTELDSASMSINKMAPYSIDPIDRSAVGWLNLAKSTLLLIQAELKLRGVTCYQQGDTTYRTGTVIPATYCPTIFTNSSVYSK